MTGFLYDRGEFVTIDVPLSLVYQALHGQGVSGINARGELVGVYNDNLGSHVYLAIPHTGK